MHTSNSFIILEATADCLIFFYLKVLNSTPEVAYSGHKIALKTSLSHKGYSRRAAAAPARTTSRRLMPRIPSRRVLPRILGFANSHPDPHNPL